MKTINQHIGKIKKIQSELNDKYTQASLNVGAMHLNCGGKCDDKGNFIMDREKAILWFANYP